VGSAGLSRAEVLAVAVDVGPTGHGRAVHGRRAQRSRVTLPRQRPLLPAGQVVGIGPRAGRRGSPISGSAPPIHVTTVLGRQDSDHPSLLVDGIQHPITAPACRPAAPNSRCKGFPTRRGSRRRSPVMNSSTAAATASGRPLAIALAAGLTISQRHLDPPVSYGDALTQHPARSPPAGSVSRRARAPCVTGWPGWPRGPGPPRSPGSSPRSPSGPEGCVAVVTSPSSPGCSSGWMRWCRCAPTASGGPRAGISLA